MYIMYLYIFVCVYSMCLVYSATHRCMHVGECVCVCVCVCLHACACAYQCLRGCMHAWMCAYACVSDLGIYLYACVDVCLYALMPGCLGVHTCLISTCLDSGASMCVRGQMHVHVGMGSTYMYVYVLYIHKTSYIITLSKTLI